MLEIYLSLSGGSIENVVITGDFFSTTQDINRIENALKWASAREESIGEKLSQVWREDMIYGVDVPTLTRAILLAKGESGALMSVGGPSCTARLEVE